MSPSDTDGEAAPARVARLAPGLARLLEPVEERPSLGAAVRTTARVCSLLLGLGVVAWATGRAFLFPSLGPSAYALAVSPSAATSEPPRVFGGHLFGVVGGLAAYQLFAPGLTVLALPPTTSAPAAMLAASAVGSIALTSALMLATDLRHAPACATTLIVSLGLLSTVREGVVILLAVGLLLGLDAVLPDFGGVVDPPR